MRRIKQVVALGASVVLGLTGVVNAETGQPADLQAELATLKARIAELEGKQGQNWLNERRAEEVKTLVRQVLSDADTRASLLEGGATAGHNGENFFLASEDGSFLMKINGQLDMRYVWNMRDNNDDDDIDDESEFGFEVRRAKLQFSGHIADPRLHYAVRLRVNHADNDVDADRIVIAYDLMDNLRVWAGEDKAPFLREELVESYHQLAVDRSLLNEIFTAGYAQGVGVTWDPHDMVKVAAMFSDGLRSGEPDGRRINILSQPGIDDDGDFIEDLDDFENGISKRFHEDRSDIAITARVDVRVMGDWQQWQDFSAWSGEEMAVFVGGAIHWEQGETGDPFLNNDLFAWTIDASVETNGLGVYGALVGFSTDNDSPAEDVDLWGFMLQASYFVQPDKWEVFARYEWMDLDDIAALGSVSEDDLSLVTIGTNYYFNNHNAKFQLDLVWALDAIDAEVLSAANLSDLGLLGDAEGEDGQMALRAQFQLLF